MAAERLLDVPITETEHHRRNSDQERLLSSRESYNSTNSESVDLPITRFKSLQSLQTSIQQVNQPDHNVKSPIYHQRIPSRFDEEPQKIVDFDQATRYTHRASYDRLEYPPDLWKPFWLRKDTLGLFLFLYLAIVVVVVLLWHFSNVYDGYSYSTSTAYYAWTYIPVAIMIMIVSLWRQVDYYSKLLAPWNDLRDGPVFASRSLLLDYVSPINIVSFVKAFKRGNVSIIASITVFFCLKVITIFSPALFVSLPTVVMLNSPSAVSTKAFDASSFTSSTSTNASLFTSDPVYLTLGNIAYGLPYEVGVTPEYAYIPITIAPSASPDLANATYTAETEALFPNLSCAQIDVRVIGNTTIQANRTTANSTNSYIPLRLPDGNVCQHWNSTTVFAMNPYKQVTPARQLEGTMQRVYCAKGETEGSQALDPAGLLFTLTDIRYHKRTSPNGTIINSTRTVSNMVNLLCIPGYYILTANMTNSSATFGADAVNIKMSGVGNRTLDGLPKRSLAVLYERLMNASPGIFGTRDDNTQALNIPKTVFNLMALVAQKNSIEQLFDASVFQAAAETTFQRVMSHYAAQSLTKPSTASVTIQATYTKQKLHLNLVPCYIVLVCAAVSALCTILLLLVSPGPLVPKDPSSIAMAATVLARSPELNQLLRRQFSSKTALRDAMSTHEYSSALATTDLGQTSYKIVVTGTSSATPSPRIGIMRKWWSPNALLIPAFAVTVIIPIIIMVVLHLLQRKSDSDQGIATLTMGPYTNLYIRCVPVVVLLLTAAVVEYLDFYVSLLSPWNKLQGGDVGPKHSILDHLSGKTPPVALVDAISGWHFGAMFAILAAIMASVVVIIASGLYSVVDITTTGLPEQMVAADAFQFQNRYGVLNDLGAAGILRMADASNLSLPRGTFDDFVFSTYSQLSTPNASSSSVNQTIGPFTATLPALRANLRCDFAPSTKLNVTYIPASQAYNADHWKVDTVYNLPEFCYYGGPKSNSSAAWFRNLFNVTSNDTVLYGGQLLDLVFGRNSSLFNHYGETNPGAVGDNPAVGCPSLSFTFAQFDTRAKTSQVTSMICYQEVERLEVNVTYQANSSEFDRSYRPVVKASSGSFLTNQNSTTKAKTFDFRIQRNIERQLYGLNGARLQSSSPTTTYKFDAFFSYLLNNTLKHDPATVVGASEQQALFNAINSLYRKYMAQAINANMRIPITTTSTPLLKRQSSQPPVDLQTHVVRPRLVQDKSSKLAMQILLGLTALFSIFAYLLTSFHHLLPSNPCSIAGTMSLLAGSDLCWSPDDALCDCCGLPRRSSWNHEEAPDREETIEADPSEYHNSTPVARQQLIPDGAEWMDHRKFAKVFSGRTYSLGWWKQDRAKGRRKRFGVDVGSRPDGEREDDWELGDRRPLGEQQGFENIVMRGRNILGDRKGLYQRAGVEPGEFTTTPTPMPMPGPGPVPMTSPSPRPEHGYGTEYGRGYGNEYGYGPNAAAATTRSPPVPGVMSPRRVRFEDGI